MATRPNYVLVLTVNKEIALHIMTLHVWKTSFYERYINWSENEKMNWILSKVDKKFLIIKIGSCWIHKLLLGTRMRGTKFDLLIWWLDRCLEIFIINEILQTIKQMKRLMDAL